MYCWKTHIFGESLLDGPIFQPTETWNALVTAQSWMLFFFFFRLKKTNDFIKKPNTLFQALYGLPSFIIYLILCFRCIFLLLKLLLKLLLEDLQGLVLQMKLLRLGDLSECAFGQRIDFNVFAPSMAVKSWHGRKESGISNQWIVVHTFTFDLSSTYWSSFSGSFFSNLWSFMCACSLRSKAFLALLISSRRSSASFREAYRWQSERWELNFTAWDSNLCVCVSLSVNLVVVLNFLISLLDSCLVLFCLCYFSLCHVKFLLQGQFVEAVWYDGAGTLPFSTHLRETQTHYKEAMVWE